MCSHFRCEDATFTEDCDVSMQDSIPSTQLTTDNIGYLIFTPGYYCPTKRYAPNRAYKAILPAKPGHCWVLYPLKSFDGLKGTNPCNCRCEDHIKMKEKKWLNSNEAYFCGPSNTWCPNHTGPDNLNGLIPFIAGQ